MTAESNKNGKKSCSYLWLAELNPSITKKASEVVKTGNNITLRFLSRASEKSPIAARINSKGMHKVSGSVASKLSYLA